MFGSVEERPFAAKYWKLPNGQLESAEHFDFHIKCVYLLNLHPHTEHANCMPTRFLFSLSLNAHVLLALDFTFFVFGFWEDEWYILEGKRGDQLMRDDGRMVIQSILQTGYRWRRLALRSGTDPPSRRQALASATRVSYGSTGALSMAKLILQKEHSPRPLITR